MFGLLFRDFQLNRWLVKWLDALGMDSKIFLLKWPKTWYTGSGSLASQPCLALPSGFPGSSTLDLLCHFQSTMTRLFLFHDFHFFVAFPLLFPSFHSLSSLTSSHPFLFILHVFAHTFLRWVPQTVQATCVSPTPTPGWTLAISRHCCKCFACAISLIPTTTFGGSYCYGSRASLGKLRCKQLNTWPTVAGLVHGRIRCEPPSRIPKPVTIFSATQLNSLS